MRIPSAIRGLLATVVALAALQPGAVGAQDGMVERGLGCTEAFAVAEGVVRAVEASPAAGSAAVIRTILLDLTIAACADRQTWLVEAAAHPVAVGGGDPQAILAARCSDPVAALGGVPVCVDETAPTLIARPGVKPQVKGAQRTRYYPIRGLSPDVLFTQMQVNGAALCPTHAVACVTIQPVLRPLVTTGSTCRVIGIQASLSIDAALPRWAGPARIYPELAVWWRKVAARIGRHEQEHIRIAERQLARLRRDIVGRSCSSLSTYVSRWSQGLTAAQNAFDAKELDRPWPAYDGPLP